MQYLPLRLDGEKVSVYSHRSLKQMIEYVGLSHVKQKFISLSEVETLVSPFDSALTWMLICSVSKQSC